MYIKEVCIDGFKSYAQRTVIDGFDPSFNAITGLNGTGKSNILDSICFVLGINNLNQVRAASLQDLVYKSGQAGITKATVSITFDNSKKDHSPVGYEQYNEITVTRQVVIGGRNKYLINGTNAQNNRVTDLFRSVQMNVNNPHFLIMQGRITKVLNMKPPEILSMLEEAAGTKMYESKKIAALRTIEKKDTKLAEINQILAQEITPTLEKLKNDRASYLEFQGLEQEILQLSRITIAADYVRLKESQSGTEDKVADIQKQISDIEKNIEDFNSQCGALTKDIERMEARAMAEVSSDQADSLHSLNSTLSECQNKETVLTTSLDHQRDALRSEENKRSQLSERIDTEKSSIATKSNELQELLASIAQCEEESKRAEEELDDAQKRLQAVSMGLATGNREGEDATLPAQLLAAKDELSRAEVERKNADVRLKHLRTQLKAARTNLGKAEGGYMDAKKILDKGSEEIKRLEERLGQINYEDGSEERLRNERRQLASDFERLKRQLADLEDSIPRLNFNYRKPSPNFDSAGVKGLVAKLLHLRDPRMATAIEVAAGDRLYNVIVETENVAKEILKNGQLQQRVTFIPLNKISTQVISPEVVQRAKRLVGEDNCHLALAVVDYDPRLQSAMEYVFGNTLLCTDMDAAKKVTFDPAVLKRTVTLRGEIFDPQGTLTGGSRKENAMLLSKLHGITTEISAKDRQVKEIDSRVGNLSNSANEWRALQEKMASTRRDVETAKINLENSDHHQQLEAIKQMEKDIKETEESLARSTETIENAGQRVAELQDQIGNADKYRDRETAMAEARLNEAKKKAERTAALLKQNQEGIGALQVAIKELQLAIEGFQTELGDVEKRIDVLRKEIEGSVEELNAAKVATREADARASERREAVRARNEEITRRQREHECVVKEKRKAELQVKKLQQEEEQVISDADEAVKRLEHLVAHHRWIKTDAHLFGQPGTGYDFVSNNADEAAARLARAKARKEQLQRTVNMRAMTMLGRAEEQYDDLIKKQAIVETDKSKIEAVIRELDEKKRQAIEQAWAQVNRDFGSIFSTLLPGARAKLEPPAGLTPLDGLEVRVGFGDVWKESLAELSGGQRSLVALSLILAMLLFKPAPIYILDEVDAALDISHTQNIGHMLRSHFKHSQFIVVSLKEGMFNNANVLFQTRFVDGCSNVSRRVQGH